MAAAIAGDMLEDLELLPTDPVDTVHGAGLYLGS